MSTMRAIGFRQFLPSDDPASLEDFVAARPQAMGRDMLVRVEAISVNPVDYNVR